MVTRAELRDGMKVRSSDGHGLGKIIRLDGGILVIEKGFFFPKDYEVPISLVSEVRDDEVWLSVSKEALEREGGFVAGEGGSIGAGTMTGASTAYEAGDDRLRETAAGASPEIGTGEPRAASTETRVPLAEEELEASKRTREGEVRVTKDVVTEHRTIDVPVTREEVHVERVPASASSGEVSGDAFQEKSVVVPVREEEVEIHKRPRVREEVRVSKTSRTVEQRADADVKREEARVERTDEPGSAIGSAEDEASRSDYGATGADTRGGGILGLGKDEDR
jgi:uncharacterized protein (TIGR02271 family)